jgi:hypothetical protein
MQRALVLLRSLRYYKVDPMNISHHPSSSHTKHYIKGEGSSSEGTTGKARGPGSSAPLWLEAQSDDTFCNKLHVHIRSARPATTLTSAQSTTRSPDVCMMD